MELLRPAARWRATLPRLALVASGADPRGVVVCLSLFGVYLLWSLSQLERRDRTASSYLTRSDRTVRLGGGR